MKLGSPPASVRSRGRCGYHSDPELSADSALPAALPVPVAGSWFLPF